MEDPQAGAEKLHNAFSDKKNREDFFVDTIINNDLEHRLLIAKKYGELFKTPLYEDIKNNLSGHFKELCGYCFLTPWNSMQECLKKDLKAFQSMR